MFRARERPAISNPDSNRAQLDGQNARCVRATPSTRWELIAWLLSMLYRSHRTCIQVDVLGTLTIAAVHPLLACPRTTRTAVYPVWVAPRAADKFLWHSHRDAPRHRHVPPVPPFFHWVPLIAGLPCCPPPFGFQLPLLPMELLFNSQTLGMSPRTRVPRISVSDIKFCCIGGTR